MPPKADTTPVAAKPEVSTVIEFYDPWEQKFKSHFEPPRLSARPLADRQLEPSERHAS